MHKCDDCKRPRIAPASRALNNLIKAQELVKAVIPSYAIQRDQTLYVMLNNAVNHMQISIQSLESELNRLEEGEKT